MKREMLKVMLSLMIAEGAQGFSVPTVQEYVHSLEYCFSNGASAASIKANVATNGLYSFSEILPFCYNFTADINDLEASILAYKQKIKFIEAVLPRYSNFIHLSTNDWNSALGHLDAEEEKIQRAILARYEANPTEESLNYLKQLYPMSIIGMYSIPVSPALDIRASTSFAKTPSVFVAKLSRASMPIEYEMLGNVSSYNFSRESLYAELSTNTRFRAAELFRYCIVDKGDFATNNIAIAEKQVWRNNFVLELVAHSCNLHTNEANRVLDSDYRGKLGTLCDHYALIPADSLGMTGNEKAEWLARLQATINAYTNVISPFGARPAP